MASVTRRLAFYDLRDWWLSEPRVRELLGISDQEYEDYLNPDPEIGPIIPFFPVAQQPEGGFPYIRYDVSRRNFAEQWWIHGEAVGIEVFMEDIEDSTELINILIDMSAMGDRSARDLQRWVVNEVAEHARPQDFQFHSVEYTGGGEIGASNEQGGAVSRVVTFLIQYSPLAGRYIA
jgi:hypothetical protein